MKSLGLIGGTSWHSTVEYYKHINQYVNDFFGNNTNPPLLVYTLNQAKIHQYQIENKWDQIAELLIQGAKKLERGGAERLMFCANTPHKVYEKVQNEIDTTILHIADTTAEAIKRHHISKVCFLGTKYTMQEPFVSQRIEQHGLQVITPNSKEVIDELHRIIQEELTYGNIIQQSKNYVTQVIDSLVAEGAQGVVLGCTEFPLMFTQAELKIPTFNTTHIHAMAGAQFILKDLTHDKKS